MELGTGLEINAGSSSPGLSFSSTASTGPTLTVTATEFYGNPNVAGTTLNVNCGVTVTTTAGCGTVQVNGNLGTLTLNVKGYRTNLGPNSWATNADGYYLDLSFDEDFGGAPTTYEGGGTAAAHLVTDLRLGSGVTAENTTTHNGTSTGTGLLTASPVAAASGAVPGDTNDGVATFANLNVAMGGSTYTVTPTISGATRNGEICGWIDFNRNNSFAASEGACSVFSAGSTSVPVLFNVPAGMTAGNTYARFRVTYDTGITTSSFNGLFSSGEVEDYQLPITPAADLVISKSNGSTGVTSGTGTTYSLVVTNNGPSSVTGAVINDTIGSGLNCPSANTVTITGSGVPAGSFTVSNLTGSGIALGALASGQSATLSFACTVL